MVGLDLYYILILFDKYLISVNWPLKLFSVLNSKLNSVFMFRVSLFVQMSFEIKRKLKFLTWEILLVSL